MPSLLKPGALKPGAVIAVVSASAPTPQADEAFERGRLLLEDQGFQVRLMPHAADAWAYLAGSDVDRLSDLHAAFADPGVDAVLCARGGYGAMRLLPHLDFDCIRRHPKVFIGFSDVTALHLAFYQKAGLVGFYGPMLTSNLIHNEPDSLADLLRVVSGNEAIPMQIRNRDPYHCFQGGVAEGPLTGGNLSLLSSLCGTPFQPETAGHILFIEDWKEQFYTLDRQFQQLAMSGVFDAIRGLLLCDFSEIPDEDVTLSAQLKRLVGAIPQLADVPVGYGFSVGHGAQTATLPIGIQARFDASAGQLTLLESPVA
ncbi:MAG: LD-carboxypeptidase [Candidatus Melainabacteria bacterium]